MFFTNFLNKSHKKSCFFGAVTFAASFLPLILVSSVHANASSSASNTDTQSVHLKVTLTPGEGFSLTEQKNLQFTPTGPQLGAGETYVSEDFNIWLTKDERYSDSRTTFWDGYLTFEGTRLCNSHFRGSSLSNDQDSFRLLGVLDSLRDLDFTSPDVQTLDLEKYSEELYNYIEKNSLEVLKITRLPGCLKAKGEHLYEAVQARIVSRTGEYDVLYFDQTLEVHKRAFHSSSYTETSQLRVFETRVSDNAETVDVEIEGMAADGTLSSESHKLKNSPSSDGSEFFFGEDTSDFAKSSIFYWAKKHFDYLGGIGYRDYVGLPIEITYPDPSNANNAAYRPGSSTDAPEILIGVGGGGTGLVNLGLDEDVVSHEIGHHVVFEFIYSGITATSEPTMLHEGLSDFFVHQRTGDGCIGESICPEDSTVCYFISEDTNVNSCLRHTDIDFVYKDDTFNSLGSIHVKSQVVSAMLHKLSESFTQDDIGVFVYESLKRVPPNSNLGTFLMAMFVQDKEVHESNYREAIRSAAEQYGMSSLTEDVPTDPAAELPAIDSLLEGEPSEPVEQGTSKTESKKSEKPWWSLGCSAGVYTGSGISNKDQGFPLVQLILLSFLLLVPLVLNLKQLPEPALKKNRNHDLYQKQ